MSIRFGRSGNGYDSSQVMKTADDDWRQITDLAERRKIQNRLAQRNYRRKLRERLEELERQAGESSSVISKSAKQSNPATSNGATSGRITKRIRANSARTIRTQPEDWRLQVPRTQSAEPRSASDNSPTTPTTLGPSFPSRSAPRHYLGGDFGPLFSTVDARSTDATAGPTFQTSIWDAEHQYQNSEHFLASSPELHAPSPPPVGGYSSVDHASSYGSDISSNYSPNYSPNPSVTSDYYFNPTVARDNTYLAVNYNNKAVHGTMRVNKALNIEDTCIKQEEVSPFTKQEEWCLPEQPVVSQQQYIDTIPFKEFLDSLEFETTNIVDERNYVAIPESWAVWGQIPFESRGYEAGEGYIR